MLSVNFHTKVKAKQGRNSNNHEKKPRKLRNVQMFGWDKGLDYEKTYKLILNHMREAARDTTKAYDIILLTQLRNGSRLTESINFLNKIIETKPFKRQATIIVEKRKDKYERQMVLPEEISKAELMRVSYVIKEANKWKVSTYCKRTYGFNTHALRYAFISYLSKKGVSPQIIAKITGHKSLEYIVYYTQQVQAEEVLKNLSR